MPTELRAEKSDTDGLAEAKSAPAGMKNCPTCDGTGTILAGNRDCPDCDGTGYTPMETNSQAPEGESPESPEVDREAAPVVRRSPIVQVKKRRGSHRSGPPLGREFRFRRFIDADVELREEGTSGDLIAITGKPIVYNTPYSVRDMFGEFQETMLPGVANDVLSRGADVRFLFNHGGGALARSTTGTLLLTDTPTALGIRAVLDIRDPMARSLAVKIERGDVSQMSCGFCVANDMWNETEDQRSINKFSDLFDVSAVDYPASPTTNVELALRSIFARPVESQARVRQLWVGVGKDFRDGGQLTAEHATRLQSAVEALQSTEDFDTASIIRSQSPDAVDEQDGEVVAEAAVAAEATEPDTESRTIDPSLVALQLEAEQLRLHGQRHRAA